MSTTILKFDTLKEMKSVALEAKSEKMAYTVKEDVRQIKFDDPEEAAVIKKWCEGKGTKTYFS